MIVDKNAEGRSPDGTITLDQVKDEELQLISTGFVAVDTCLGGGVLDTTVGLLGGEPGAGKSTLSLQIACKSAHEKNKVMYVAAEESEAVIRRRALRLGLQNFPHVRIFPQRIIGQTDLRHALRVHGSRFVILDSLQGFCGDDLRAQVELAHAVKGLAMELQLVVIIISHVTKDEGFAGLMALQHEVDWTAILSSTEEGEIRELTTNKNRMGAAHVTREMLMTAEGLWEPQGDLARGMTDEEWMRAVYERAGIDTGADGDED
jgi:DNA repair protein RadA/Sms